MNNVGDNLEHFDFPTYDIVSFEREMGTGITNPLLMRSTDGLYVVKTIDDKEEPKVLVNEFVCYKLAKLLGLPIPDAALVRIGDEIINSSPRLLELGVKPGLHFGSKFIQRAMTSIQPPMLNMVKNTDDIPSIILFDQIIYNEDRTKNKGNLLFDLKEKRLLIIDHSHVFKIGTLWNEIQLNQIMEEELCLVREFHGHNYKFLLKYVNGYNPFHKILEKLRCLNRSDIDWCFYQIPDEWGLNTKERNALANFLLHRIQNVNKFLELLKDQCLGWKGGVVYER